MRPPTDHLDMFCRAVHRRWVIVRAAEHVGVGALIGAALALLVLPVLMWRDQPAMPLVLAAVAVAAAAGLVAGILRRPGVMSAAAEADRQLDLADLLSTALLTRQRADTANDAWAMTVLATADARCRSLSANDVVLNRLGGRAWGGIGLVTALVLTVAMMSANPQQSRAVPGAAQDRLANVHSVEKGSEDSSPDSGARPREAAGAARDHAEPETGEREFGSAPNDTTTVEQASQAERLTRTSSNDGSGGGTARTAAERSHATPPPPTPATASRRLAPDGEHAAGGGGGIAESGGDAGERHGGRASTDTPPPAAAAWQSPAWPAARDQALSAVREGSLPDAYRDLVREYFAEESR